MLNFTGLLSWFKKVHGCFAIFFLLLISPFSGNAGTIGPPTAVWNQGPAPFITLFTCKNQLDANFPNISDDIESDLIQGAEEWFVGSGANIRFYYMGSLTPDNPACADMPTVILPSVVGTPPAGPQPPRWSVVLTAAPSSTNQLTFPGVERCHFAAIDRWEVPALPGVIPATPAIERVRITLVRGQTCNGGFEPWPWPDPFPPQPPTLSPARVLMKMLGHAMGLNEEVGGTDTVMAKIDPTTIQRPWRWHISDPIVQVMRAAYGPAQSSPYWAETKDQGRTWHQISGTPRLNSKNSLGLVACQASIEIAGSRRRSAYLVAETILEPNGNSVVATYFADSQRRQLGNPQTQGKSNRKPTLSCGDGLFLVGMVEPSGEIQIRRSTDGVTWRNAKVPPGWISNYAPALAEANWVWGGIVAATSSDDHNGQYLLSLDAGNTFLAPNPLFPSNWGPNFPFGLTCPKNKHRCYLTNGDSGFSLRTSEIHGPTIFEVRVSGGGEIPNLGTALTPTKNQQGFFFARRYKPGSRFFSTPGAALDQFAGSLQVDAESGSYQFTSEPFSQFVSDSPLGLFRDDLHGSFVVLSTWSNWYNGYGFTVFSKRKSSSKNRKRSQ
jgi:hypothetical protein